MARRRERVVSRRPLSGPERLGVVPVLLGLWLITSTLGCLAQTPNIALENEQLRIAFDDREGIHISSLFCKATGRDEISKERVVPLYQLVLVENGQTRELNAGQGSITKVDAQSLCIKISHPREQLEIVCDVKLPATAPTATFQLRVQRAAPALRVGLIRFPGIGIRLSPDQRSTRIVLPVADGLEIADPLRAMADGEERGYDYPGMASAQMMATYGDGGGVLTYAADGQGEFKRLTVRRRGNLGVLLFEHLTWQQTATAFSIPYPVHVGAFKGDWRDAADRYKKWASQQGWCAKRLTDKKLPVPLQSPSFYLGLVMRHQDPGGRIVSMGGELPAYAASWSAALGLPITAVIFAWEKEGLWVTPDYFPPFGGEAAFRSLTGSLAKSGGSMVFLSGLLVTLERKARLLEPAFRASPEFVRSCEKLAIVGRDGKPLRLGEASADTGERFHLCPALDASWSQLETSTRQLCAQGVNLIQIDQLCGGGAPACFSAAHGHPPAGGATVYQQVFKHLGRLQKICHDANAALALECPNELYLPVIDLFHTREYIQAHWPREKPGDRGLPLFSYLYHEYGLGYGGDSAPIVAPGADPDPAIYAQAINLTAGRFPAATSWRKRFRFDEVDATQRRFTQEVAEVLRTDAWRHLLLGKMEPLDADNRDVTTISLEIEGKHLNLEVPCILSSAFELPDGSINAVVVNITPGDIDTTLTFPKRQTAWSGRLLWPKEGGIVKRGEKLRLPGRGIRVLKISQGD